MAVLDDRAVDLRAENAELRRRLEEALAQQQATAEILQLINASPGDLAPVFDAMLEKATTLCDAPSGQLAIYDGEFFRFVAAHGDAAHVHDLLARGTMLPVSGTTWPRIVAGELVVHIPDVMESEHYRAGHENTRRFVEVSGGRCLLTVALRKDNVLKGALSVYRRHAQPFAEEQIALLQNFAAQAVIAMENARLFGELRERTADLQESLEYQTATSDVLKVISRTEAKLEAALETLVGTAARICAADQGAIHQLHNGLHFVSASFGTNPGYRDYVARNPIAPGRGTAIGRMALEGRMVHIEDVLRDPEYTGSEFQRLAGFRTVLAVPLFREDVVIGSILLTRSRVEPFTDKQIELVRTFADQAVIAIENTRLITETREALEQQTATAEVLGVINSSPGDLAPVFDAMLEKAMRLCEAAYGHFVQYDGELFHRVAVRGKPAIVEWQERRGRTSRGEGAVTFQRLLRGEAVVHIPDVMDSDAYREGNPAARALVDIGGCRTLLTVALRKTGTLVGLVSLYREGVRPFTDKQIALLQNFAAQAVIAMENARLITETREALEQQTATAEVLGVINSSPGDLNPVFDAMLEKAMRLCEASGGALRSYDGKAFHAAAMRGVPAAFVEATQIVVPDPDLALGRIERGAHIIQVPDLTDPKLSQANAQRRRELLDLGGIHTALWVALRKDEALLGVFVLYRDRVQPFTDKQVSLVENFAAQAVIAMENARLITETREALEQQTATAEVLQVINASPGDLAPVFDAMLEKATRLCSAPFGQLAIYDGEVFRFVAAHGERLFASNLLRDPHPPSDGITWLRILGGEDVVHVPDARETDLYRSGHLRTSEFVDHGGGRALLSVALRRDDALLGVLSIYRQEPQPFSDKQIALLQNFAAQAVIAMDNARLLTETREALEQQTATAEVLGVINASPGDLTPVFDSMLDKAMDLCGAAFGALMSYDGETVAAVATRGLPPELADLFRTPIAPRQDGDAPYARFLRGEPLLHILDMAADDVLPSLASRPRALVDIGGARTGLEIPLRKEGALRGSIWLYRQEVRPFSEKQIALLQNFAAQAVVAMENARLLGELRQRTDEVAELNRGLEARVAEQVEELGRVGKLKRFLAPQLAELIVSQGDENILESHRREIVVVFCDLRGFTAFAETAEPEEVLDLLREYHAALGPLVGEFEGTLDHFSGDGIMVFFNDPVPCPDPAERAVNMAVAMRAAANDLVAAWRRRGRELGFGVGIAQGYATLGQIGFADRSDYTAIGTVCNLAARLCAEAKDGQILLARRVAAAVEATVALEELGTLSLKGLAQPVAAFNVLADAAVP